MPPSTDARTDTAPRPSAPVDSPLPPGDVDGAATPTGAQVDMAKALLEQLAAEAQGMPQGDGTFTIELVDPLGRPVSGVEVELHLHALTLSSTLPARKDFADDATYLAARLLVQARQEHHMLRLRRALVTDAAGRATWSDLPGKTAHFTLASKDVAVTSGQASGHRSVNIGDTVRLTVVRMRAVTLHVNSDPPGLAERCTVSWTSPGIDAIRGSQDVALGKATELYLPALDLSVQARASHEVASEAVDLPAQASSLTLTLHSAFGLTCEVDFPAGRPGEFRVRAAKTVEGASDSELLTGGSDLAFDLTGDAAKLLFKAPRAAEGAHVVGIVAYDRVLASQRVDLSGQPRHVKLIASPDKSQVELKLRVLVPQGSQPGAGLVIVRHAAAPESRANDDVPARGSVQGGGAQIRVEVWALTDTEYLVTFPPGPAALPEQAQIVSQRSDLGAVSAEFSPGSTREVTLQFAPAARLRLDPAVEGHEGKFFMRVHRKEDNTLIWPNLERMQGEHQWHHVQPGSYVISVHVGRGQELVAYRNEVVVGPGDNVIKWEQPQLHSVKLDGTQCAPYPHGQLRQDATGMRLHLTFDDSHCRVLSDLPPGNYTVTYQPGGIRGKQKSHAFSVPSPQAVLLPK